MKQYIIDDAGRRRAVIIELEEFYKLMEYIEEMEDALELRKAVEGGGEFVDLRDFMKRMQTEGKL